MRKKQQFWRLKKKGASKPSGSLWRGQYEANERDKRFFILLRVQRNGNVKTKVFESHQMAKQLGWVLVK